jgi:hypothetical protein
VRLPPIPVPRVDGLTPGERLVPGSFVLSAAPSQMLASGLSGVDVDIARSAPIGLGDASRHADGLRIHADLNSTSDVDDRDLYWLEIESQGEWTYTLLLEASCRDPGNPKAFFHEVPRELVADSRHVTVKVTRAPLPRVVPPSDVVFSSVRVYGSLSQLDPEASWPDDVPSLDGTWTLGVAGGAKVFALKRTGPNHFEGLQCPRGAGSARAWMAPGGQIVVCLIPPAPEPPELQRCAVLSRRGGTIKGLWLGAGMHGQNASATLQPAGKEREACDR